SRLKMTDKLELGAEILLSSNLIKMHHPGSRTHRTKGTMPGEKTPYFTAKTGHMARHGIWPSDRISLRWARWVKPCHGLARWGAGCPARQMARRGPCVLTGGACTQHPLNRLGNAVSSSGAAGTGK